MKLLSGFPGMNAWQKYERSFGCCETPLVRLGKSRLYQGDGCARHRQTETQQFKSCTIIHHALRHLPIRLSLTKVRGIISRTAVVSSLNQNGTPSPLTPNWED